MDKTPPEGVSAKGMALGGISIRGVVIGGIADIVATNLLAVPVVGYVISKLDLAHQTMDQIEAAVLAGIQASPLLTAAQVAAGLAASLLGGYLAARIAGRAERLNGALSAWLCVGLGLYALAAGEHPGSALMLAAEFAGSPAAGLLGGYLRSKQARPQAAPAPAAESKGWH